MVHNGPKYSPEKWVDKYDLPLMRKVASEASVERDVVAIWEVFAVCDRILLRDLVAAKVYVKWPVIFERKASKRKTFNTVTGSWRLSS